MPTKNISSQRAKCSPKAVLGNPQFALSTNRYRFIRLAISTNTCSITTSMGIHFSLYACVCSIRSCFGDRWNHSRSWCHFIGVLHHRQSNEAGFTSSVLNWFKNARTKSTHTHTFAVTICWSSTTRRGSIAVKPKTRRKFSVAKFSGADEPCGFSESSSNCSATEHWSEYICTEANRRISLHRESRTGSVCVYKNSWSEQFQIIFQRIGK